MFLSVLCVSMCVCVSIHKRGLPVEDQQIPEDDFKFHIFPFPKAKLTKICGEYLPPLTPFMFTKFSICFVIIRLCPEKRVNLRLLNSLPKQKMCYGKYPAESRITPKTKEKRGN